MRKHLLKRGNKKVYMFFGAWILAQLGGGQVLRMETLYNRERADTIVRIPLIAIILEGKMRLIESLALLKHL